MGAHFKLKKPSFAALLRQVLKLETETINNERKNKKLKNTTFTPVNCDISIFPAYEEAYMYILHR